MILRSLTAALLLLGSAFAHAAPGDLDATFGASGYDNAPLPPPCLPGTLCSIKPSSLAVQPDGRIVIASNFRYRTGELASDNQIVLYRRLASGGPDPEFGSNGIAIPFPVACVGPIALQSDGKIVAGASFHTFYGSCFDDLSVPHVFALARFDPDGGIDTTFGIDGKARTDARIHALALQSDGRIIALKLSTSGGNASLERFNPDGTPDLTFGVEGASNLGIVPEYIPQDALPFVASYSVALTLQPDGRPVVAATSGGRIVVIRTTPDGMPDSTFNGTGRLEFESGTELALSYVINGVISLQSTGRILVSGSVGAARGYVFGIEPDGTPDSSFGIGGRAPLTRMPSGPGGAGAIVVQPNDRIVAVGYSGVQRLAAAGWRDATFLQSSIVAVYTRSLVASQGDAVVVVAPTASGLVLRRHEAGDQYDVFSNARYFAMAQYRDFLDREGDSGGIEFWSQAIASGSVSRAQVAEMFFDSAEFQGTIAPVARLYFAYFLRTPDYGGLNFWIGQFRAGNSLVSISDQFAGSPEFANRYGALTNAQFVSRVYENVLGRATDPGGFAYWTGRVDGGMTRGEMMVAFSESPEYRASINTDVYVTMMYMGMLRREPDAGGFRFWTDFMDAGNSGISLISGFLASAEYRRRFLP